MDETDEKLAKTPEQLNEESSFSGGVMEVTMEDGKKESITRQEIFDARLSSIQSEISSMRAEINRLKTRQSILEREVDG